MAKADKTSNDSQSQRSTLAAQHRKVIGEQQRHQDIDRAAKDRKLRTSTRSRSFKQARSGGGAREGFTTLGLYATVLSGILVCAAFLYWTVVLATPQEQGA